MANSGATLKMKKRLNYIVIISIMIVFAIVATNVFKITVLQHEYYKVKATNQQLKPKTIPANRGTIYDCNMEILAQSATVWDVVLSPKDMDIVQVPIIAKNLSKLLGSTPEKCVEYEKMILENSKKNNRYEIIKKRVEKEVVDKIRVLIKDGAVSEKSPTSPVTWKGVNLIENTKRYYSNPFLASSVIGFTDIDSQGLAGVEKSYNDQLSGTPGYVVSANNALGQTMPISFEDKFDPVNGNNIVLTLDETIQHFLEKNLEMAEATYKPKKGICGIVMNVNTGAVLAMAELPNFDLNNPRVISDPVVKAEIAAMPDGDEKNDANITALQRQWTNKAVSYLYQPGSTFKTMVAAAALDEKTSSLDSQFSCPGFIKVGDRTMKCHQAGGHGKIDYKGALVGSCNPAFVKIGADLGAKHFYEYYKGFGLTEKTGIDLPGENQSQYYTDKQMGVVELASCSFGQSMALTPIQLITGVSAVVNGGNLVTPHVVKDILDENNNIVKTIKPEIKRQVISSETSKTMRDLMEAVVDVRGGSNASIKGYRIGGKSGTSQKQNPGDSEEARISSYIAVAPIDKPEIAVLIMIDEPTSTTEIYGSVIAAPTCALILSEALPYLGYSPKYTAEEAAKLEIPVPYLLKKSVLEAGSKLSNIGLPAPKIIGKGNTVVKQVPANGAKIPRDGTVILYTDEEKEELKEVPNVTGLSPALAKNKLTMAGFNVIIKGEAIKHNKSKISKQSILAGVKTPIGTVVEITCLKSDTD